MGTGDFDRGIYASRGIINFLGIIGNLITFIVFCRPVFRKNSISIYCTTLALFDSYIVVQLISDVSLFFNNFYPPDDSEAWCKIYNFISTAFSAIPGWILVMFSFDKFWNMKKHHRFGFIKKRWFQVTVVLVNVVIHLGMYCGILIFLTRRSKGKNYSCEFGYMKNILIYIGMYLAEGNILPFLIMIVTSVLMTKALVSSRRKVQGNNGATANGTSSNIKSRKSRDFKFAVTSLTFNILFIVLKMPLTIYYLLFAAGMNVNSYYYQISTVLFYANSSINILVHLASNSIFRKELWILIKLPFVKISAQQTSHTIESNPVPNSGTNMQSSLIHTVHSTHH